MVKGEHQPKPSKDRGYGEDKPVRIDITVLEDVASRFRHFAEDYPHMLQTDADKLKWLTRFAERGQVPAEQLARKVGITVQDTEFDK